MTTESPAFYDSLAERRANAQPLPRPTDKLKRGKYVRCGKCKGTGDAGYNHRNGDEYCYPCMGRGYRVQFTAAEKAAIAAEQEWYSMAHSGSYNLMIQVESLARKAAQEKQGFVYHRIDNPVEADREMTLRWKSRTRRLATFWVREGLEAMGS